MQLECYPSAAVAAVPIRTVAKPHCRWLWLAIYPKDLPLLRHASVPRYIFLRALY
jgi:hypothetical protein